MYLKRNRSHASEVFDLPQSRRAWMCEGEGIDTIPAEVTFEEGYMHARQVMTRPVRDGAG